MQIHWKSNSNIISSWYNLKDLDILIDETSETWITYVWKAKIGSSLSDWVWFIMKIDETWTETKIWYAWNWLFNNIWDNRTSLTYSK